MPLSINALLAWPSGALLSNHAQTLASRWLLCGQESCVFVLGKLL
jgi:hypothetical protein